MAEIRADVGSDQSESIVLDRKICRVNLIFLPAVLLFQEVLFVREISGWMSVIVIAAGQVFLFLYDRAYEYFQGVLWNKMRGRFLN